MPRTTSPEPPVGITLGDPAGIGPECVLTTLLKNPALRPRTVVVAPRSLLEHLLRTLRIPLKPHTVTLPLASPLPKDRLNHVEPPDPPPPPVTPGHPSPTSGRHAFLSLKTAATLAQQRLLSALVTAPLAKHLVRQAGAKDFQGHTEFLAELDGARTVCMTFTTPRQAVGLATTHIPLAQVPDHLTSADLETRIVLLHDFCRRRLAPRPRLALLGLNPHAGEHGLFGDEETRLLLPLVRRLARRRIRLDGPFPPDAFWSRHGPWRSYHGIMALYHDQALIPVKAGLLGPAVHTTLGLSFLRLSPDHGTAFDIAGQGKADCGPTALAIRMAVRWTAR